MKKYADMALIYGVVAMVFGVFYREFTKWSGFAGKTTLSVIHTHYFLLGMVFFLLLLLLEKALGFSQQKHTGRVLVTYQIGLNIMGAVFLVRGLTQVWGSQLSRGMNASLSGIAGIGHILLGVSLALILLRIRRQVGSSSHQQSQKTFSQKS